MTKQEAIEAMREGKKVSHRHFSPEEWMTIEAGNIITLEDGCKCFINDFFSYRIDPSWENDYQIWG